MSTAAIARPPSKLLLLAEGRALWEAGATIALWPLLQLAPRGDGHAVIVLPGLGASDGSTELLRGFLETRGYAVQGWGHGTNCGPRPGVEDGLLALLRRLHETSGKVSLVGWSLGGVFARMLAAKAPDAVRGVVTLGSPLHGSPKATRAAKVYELLSGRPANDPRRRRWVRATSAVPTTSIFSRSDGIVSWRSSFEEETPSSENIEVEASHLGLGVHPAVFYAVADRLSMPENAWTRFAAPAGLRAFYPDPARP
ncbi:esterase/lipase family protein [Variovorax sp. MHTC-1]|uniref:esterase/lipase family protein n=1 Tax=Variovorax sp. MHTC-1 TaxID=2495593 RepID=UPI000F87B256|nr:alpha/beta hydrolase [Variovorax sp. MHTC-1]RST56219.1 alpha/beta fold hydrolase [Variovorax sp. MHTC-1]